jgi:hypothetical protein
LLLYHLRVLLFKKTAVYSRRKLYLQNLVEDVYYWVELVMPAQRLSRQNKKVLAVCPRCAQRKLAADDFKKHIVLCSGDGAGMREKIQ